MEGDFYRVLGVWWYAYEMKSTCKVVLYSFSCLVILGVNFLIIH